MLFFKLIEKTKNCDIAIVVSADSDMTPAIELAIQAGQTVFVYFPPNHYSTNLSSLVKGKVIQFSQFQSRFRQSLLPHTVHLDASNFDLQIPYKWKEYRD